MSKETPESSFAGIQPGAGITSEQADEAEDREFGAGYVSYTDWAADQDSPSQESPSQEPDVEDEPKTLEPQDISEVAPPSHGESAYASDDEFGIVKDDG